MSDIQNQQQPLADALTDALAEIKRLREELTQFKALGRQSVEISGRMIDMLNAEIERLRAEVARLEAVVALQRGSMQPHRDEYEMTQFQWNVPPDAPGNETR